MRPAKVLWVTKTLGRGGAERLLVDLARHIDQTQFALTVGYHVTTGDQLVGELESAGVQVRCFGKSHRTVDPRWVMGLRQLIRSERFDLVHTHMPLTAAVTSLVLPGSPHIPLVYTEHNMWGSRHRMTRLAHALCYGRNDVALHVSDEVLLSARKTPLPPWAARPQERVVTHGVDTTRRSQDALVQAVRQSLGLGHDDQVITNVASFTAKKDHKTLLEAFSLLRQHAALRDRRGSLRLVCVGSGPLEESIQQLARTLGLADAVVFTGSRDDVYDILSASDLFTLSSKYEGLSIAMLEAMACGLPPVVTDVGGARQAITHAQNGWIVPPSDPAALAEAWAHALTHDDLRKTVAIAAAHRAKDFDISCAAAEYSEVYRSLLASRGTPLRVSIA